MLELWGMRSTSPLPSLPGPLWPGVIASDKALSLGQIELVYVLMLNWIGWNRTVYRYKIDLARITFNVWCIIKPNQTIIHCCFGHCVPEIRTAKIHHVKESKMMDKYLNLVRDLKTLWNMKVMFIRIVVGTETGGGEIGNQRKESRSYRPQQCWDRLEYREKFWGRKICCHSRSSKKKKTHQLTLVWKTLQQRIIF